MSKIQRVQAALLAFLLLPVLSHAQGTADDEAAIRQTIAAHGEAWTQKDIGRAVAVYHPSASVRLSSGREFTGHAEIEQWHRSALATPAMQKAVHLHPPESHTIRFVRPDLAIVDVGSVFTGLTGEDGKELPPAHSMLVVVLVKEQGQWRVIAQRTGAAPPR